MLRSLSGLVLFGLLLSSSAASASEAEYLQCKQGAYETLMDRYQKTMPDQAQSVTEAQGDRITSEANEYERDYDRAQATCASRYPERDTAKYNACVLKHATDPTLDCEGTYPERDVAKYNQCIDGAVNAGAKRFSSFLAKDAGVTNKPEVQALISQYQADYARAVAECANLRDNSPVNSSISSCESASSSATSSCATDVSSAGLGGPNGDSMGSTCAETSAKTQAAMSSLSSVQTLCSSAVKSCQSACSQAESQVGSLPASQRSSFQSRIPSAKAKCETAQSQLDGINQAMNRAQSSQANSTQCNREVTGENGAADQAAASNAVNAQPSRLGDAAGSGGTTPLAGVGAAASTTSGDSFDDGGGGSGAGGSDSVGTFASAAAAAATPFANALSSLTGGVLGGTSSGGSDGMLSSGASANKADAPGAKGASGSKVNPNVLNGKSASGRGSFSALRREAGLYRANGSWIPPKVGEKKDGLQNVDMDRFRPDMQGLRKPSSDDPRAQIAAANQDIWRNMNHQYSTQGPTFLP